MPLATDKSLDVMDGVEAPPVAEKTETSYPDFDAAMGLFEDFLASQGRPRNVVWVFRDTIAMHRNTLFLWVPRLCQEDGFAPIRDLYAEGRRSGYGARMINVAFDDQRSICYLWIPRDESEATCSALHGALRMSIGPPIYGLYYVQRALAWALLKFRNRLLRRYGLENEIPARPGRAN